MDEGLKILVAYDGSNESKKAVQEAADMAKRYKGSITILNVYWDPVEKKSDDLAVKIENVNILDEGGYRILDDLEPTLKKMKVQYKLRVEREPNVPKTILRIADQEGFGCIALGCRGLGSARAWLLGSVSSRVIAEATIPVLVV